MIDYTAVEERIRLKEMLLQMVANEMKNDIRLLFQVEDEEDRIRAFEPVSDTSYDETVSDTLYDESVTREPVVKRRKGQRGPDTKPRKPRLDKGKPRKRFFVLKRAHFGCDDLFVLP